MKSQTRFDKKTFWNQWFSSFELILTRKIQKIRKIKFTKKEEVEGPSLGT